MDYSLEELYPVLKRLSRKYTQNSSTSIPYEVAEQLMEAILYCINENPQGHEERGLTVGGITADVAYGSGYKILIQKIHTTLEQYNEIMKSFNDFGSRAYGETVADGLGEFFRKYDAEFCPQDHLLTLDYPILEDLHSLQGGDLIEQYVGCIWQEQQFLRGLPESHVSSVLSDYQQGYRDLFVNVCGIVLRKLLCSMLIQWKDWEKKFGVEEYRRLEEEIKACSREQLAAQLSLLLKFVVDNGFDGSLPMLRYLGKVIDDLAAELINGANQGYLNNIV